MPGVTPPGYLFREGPDRSLGKGAKGVKRSPLTPAPIHREAVPVILDPGAHGPADQLRFSDLSRDSSTRTLIFFGPPVHDSWPESLLNLRTIQRKMQGNRPADAKIIRRRQYPRPSQSGRARTDVPQQDPTSILEGSF